VIVGGLTLGLTAAAVRLQVGIPAADSTQIGDLADASAGRGLFGFFQLTTALLLLAAASSSFQAGPRLLKALARRRSPDGNGVGILPGSFGATNTHHTPYWGVVLFLAVSAAVTAAAGARDQELVLSYAVSLFMSFLSGAPGHGALLAPRRAPRLPRDESRRRRRRRLHARREPRPRPPDRLRAPALTVAGGLCRLWVRAGRPRGIADAVAGAEQSEHDRPQPAAA
jgi:amino acid transporter